MTGKKGFHCFILSKKKTSQPYIPFSYMPNRIHPYTRDIVRHTEGVYWPQDYHCRCWGLNFGSLHSLRLPMTLRQPPHQMSVPWMMIMLNLLNKQFHNQLEDTRYVFYPIQFLFTPNRKGMEQKDKQTKNDYYYFDDDVLLLATDNQS